MDLLNKIKEAIRLSKISPVLVVGIPSDLFGKSTIIEANIPPKDLGIVYTSSGLKMPEWFFGIAKGKASHQIVIDGIDLIDKEDQEKFYELLKYKAISDIDLPSDCTIIITAENLKNVSETILRLSLLVE